jgi:hypothetical protein
LTSTPAGDGEPRTETGRRPLAMASQGDRGPAYTAAVERSGAAFDHVRRVLGGPVRLIGDAGELAALAAGLLPETPVSIGDVVQVAVPGQASVPAVAVTVTTYAGTPQTPVRDERGREYDVLYPGIELGTVLLPGPDADPGDPGTWKPWRAWDRMADAQDRGEADEALNAIAAVIDLIKDKLTDTGLSPSGFLAAGSVVPAGIAGAAGRLADLAEGLRGLAALAAEEARRDLEDDDGTDRIGIAFLTRVTGRAPATDPALGYLLCQAAADGKPLGDGEAWDYPAIRNAHDTALTRALATSGITWQPGEPAAVLPPGQSIGDTARIWTESCDRAAEAVAGIAAETTAGRPAGDTVRPDNAPGRQWVTESRD